MTSWSCSSWAKRRAVIASNDFIVAPAAAAGCDTDVSTGGADTDGKYSPGANTDDDDDEGGGVGTGGAADVGGFDGGGDGADAGVVIRFVVEVDFAATGNEFNATFVVVDVVVVIVAAAAAAVDDALIDKSFCDVEDKSCAGGCDWVNCIVVDGDEVVGCESAALLIDDAAVVDDDAFSGLTGRIS